MKYTFAYKLHVPVPYTDIYMCKSVNGMSWIGNKIIFTETDYIIDTNDV